MLNFIKDNPIICIIIFLLIVSPSLLVGAIQFFAIAILVLIVIAVIALLTLKWRVQKIQKEANKGYQGGYNQSNGANVDVDMQTSSTKKRVADDVGDYVDFEEIKDK
ncbi:MAG: hypothetical protein SNH55_02035 [Rikenellaceae bacterium]